MTDDIALAVIKHFHADVQLLNTIGAKACKKCSRWNVPNLKGRDYCYQCIKNDVLNELEAIDRGVKQ